MPIRVGANAAIVEDGRILLVRYDATDGYAHYNLPGGGVEDGESLHEAVRREVMEETCVEVEVGRLLLVYEYVPAAYDNAYGTVQKLGLIFEATIIGGTPRLPDLPDAMQDGVVWVPLDQLANPNIPLLPRVAPELIAAIEGRLPDPFYQGRL